MSIYAAPEASTDSPARGQPVPRHETVGAEMLVAAELRRAAETTETVSDVCLALCLLLSNSYFIWTVVTLAPG